jgi:hypothetical protein
MRKSFIAFGLWFRADLDFFFAMMCELARAIDRMK